MYSEINLRDNILLIIMILFFVILLIIGLVIKINAFSQEMAYINKEIECTTGSEQRYWKREKRRLWLSLLPFYRR